MRKCLLLCLLGLVCALAPLGCKGDCTVAACARYVCDWRVCVITAARAVIKKFDGVDLPWPWTVCQCVCHQQPQSFSSGGQTITRQCPGGRGYTMYKRNRPHREEDLRSPLNMAKSYRFTASASLDEENVQAMMDPLGLLMVRGTLVYKGERKAPARNKLTHFIPDADSFSVLLAEDGSSASEATLVRPTTLEEDTLPVFYYEALVHTPENYTGIDLLQLPSLGYTIVSAPTASAEEILRYPSEEGHVLRRITYEFNVYAMTNSHLYNSLIEVHVDPDTGELTHLLEDVKREAHERSQGMHTGGDFTLEFDSPLSLEHLEHAGTSGIVTLKSISASSSSLSAGAIVGIVLGSVVAFLLLSSTVVGAVIVGRTIITRRKMNSEKNARASPVEMTAVHQNKGDVEMDESAVAKPKFSIQVMGNSEFAGSLTMRNPQLL